MREALDFVKQHPAEVILFDSGFEIKKGLYLLKEIKDLHPDVPIIFLTEDKLDDSAAAETFRAGARDFVEKPVNIFQLQNKIKNLLRIKRISKEKRTPFIPSQDSDIGETFRKITTNKPVCVLRAILYIEENLSEKISLDMLAKVANLSKYHFCRLFSRHTGMTPMKFATFMRIHRAKELLKKEDLTVSIIATQVGFNDLGTLIRQFKKHASVTPTTYKNSLNKI